MVLKRLDLGHDHVTGVYVALQISANYFQVYIILRRFLKRGEIYLQDKILFQIKRLTIYQSYKNGNVV